MVNLGRQNQRRTVRVRVEHRGDEQINQLVREVTSYATRLGGV
eukprot:SAG11_NODE_6127_length_1383_cov_1.566978_2_plen_43_part_00